MPIASLNPISPELEMPRDTVVVTQLPTQVAYVDTKLPYNRQRTTFLEGYSWILPAYYEQILGAGEAPRQQDSGQSGIYQQYTEIKGLELKVTQALQPAQDTATGATTLSGSANFYSIANLIPNKGNMFCADIGDGREGVFTITNVEKKSIFNSSAYAVDYTLVYVANDHPERRADLKNKTVKSLNFVKDLFYAGQDPMVIDDEFASYQRLTGFYYELIGYYFDTFYSNRHKTLLVPSQTSPTFDWFATSFFLKMLRSEDHLLSDAVHTFDNGSDRYMNQDQLYSVIAKASPGLLKVCNRCMGLVANSSFLNPAYLKGLAANSMQRVVYPDSPIGLVDDKPPIGLCANSLDPSSYPRTSADFSPATSTDSNQVIWVHPVTLSPTYVFSPAFYNKDQTGQSVIELLVWKYITEQPLRAQELTALLDNYYFWGTLEQYYAIPICLALIKAIDPEVR